MKKIFRSFVIGFFLVSLSMAQNPSSAVWALTANQAAVVTGDVTALDQQLTNMQVSYSSGVQRSSPTGTAGTWTAESAENSTRYMQFVVSPKSAFDFTVASVSMKLYVNSGSGMSANIYYSTDSTFAIKTKIGNTLTLSSSAPSSPNVSVSPNIVVSGGRSLYVRVYAWYNTATTGKYVIANSVSVSGTTLNATAPLISVSANSLPNFSSTVSGSLSNGTTYSVSAINLIENLIVAAPKGFKVGKDSANYFDSVSISPVSGTVSKTNIYTQFAPNSASGLVEDVITNKSKNAVSKLVTVIGISLAAEPLTQSAITLGTITGKSVALNFSGGNGNRRIVVARKDSAVNFLSTDGVEISGVDSNFSAALNQGNGNKVVYDGAGSSVVVAGLSVASKYYFAVFEYNIGSGNSHNYNNVNTGTANATTLAVPGISVNAASISFGNVVVNKVSNEKSYQLIAQHLIPASSSVNLKAAKGFEISLSSGSGFDSAITVSYTNSTIDAKTIFVRFTPTEKINYSGSISHNGGGADEISISLKGNGVDQIIVPDSIPFGFASLGGGTTGGKGGTEIILTSAQQMADIMRLREKTSDPGLPIILYVSGTVIGYPDAISIKRTKNVSVIGLGTDAKIQGFGFKIVESSNIIIHNITFADCKVGEKDAVSVESSNNVWVDHCSFTDSPSIDISGSSHDGLLDVKKGSYNITLSYNYFTNHRKTCLLGHSVSETGDVAMRVTYYRNWFDGTYSRHPRARYGKAHILNNLYTGVGVVGADKGGYGIGSTCGAHLLVEANYFENTPTPTLISQVNDPGGTLSGDPIGYLKGLNNFTDNSGAIVENLNGYSFDPSESYSYTPTDAQQVKEIVKASAGAGKIENGTTSVIKTSNKVPAGFSLEQNYPNPFNPTTTISYTLSPNPSPLGRVEGARVTLKIYDALGREVTTLVNEEQSAGSYSVAFNASQLSSGIYFYRLQAGAFSVNKKMILTK